MVESIISLIDNINKRLSITLRQCLPLYSNSYDNMKKRKCKRVLCSQLFSHTLLAVHIGLSMRMQK